MPRNEEEQSDEKSIESALRWFAEIADLPAAEQRRRLGHIEEDDVRASVEQMLAGDRSADPRLERCMIAVAALHERAGSETRGAGHSILRFVLDRVRREARHAGSDWTPSASLTATIESLLHDSELSSAEREGLQQPDLRRGTDSIAALIALRTEAGLSIALADARDAQVVGETSSTSILVLRDEVDTHELDLDPFVETLRRHLDERTPTSDRIAVLAEPAAFATLGTRLRTRRVDAPGALRFHSASDLTDGKVLGRNIAHVEVLELDASCQLIEDHIFGLIKAPRESGDGIVDPWIGRLLHDKYRILDIIGAGGFGTVYEARDERGAGNIVAIKILRPHVAQRPHLLQAFKNEARRATRLNHPNIVDWKVFDETSDGVQYFVMERLVGEELADLLEREGSLPPERAAAILLGITEALCAAHHLGVDEAILHLDLKPANIFVLPPEVATAERIKVLDFGIGQYVGGEDGELTTEAGSSHAPTPDDVQVTTPHQRTSLVFRGLDELPTPVDQEGRPFHRSTACTPEYASPEHCEHVLGRERIMPLDGRSDLFSLGVLAFRMLTGEMPFPHGIVRTDLIRMHAEEPARKIASTGVSLPKRLARFVDRCLELEREQRFESAREALEELRAIVQRPVRTLAWSVAVAALLVTLLAVGFTSDWFEAERPRLALTDGARSLDPGEQLFLGPARNNIVLSVAGHAEQDFVPRSLDVGARGAEAPALKAEWLTPDSIELHAPDGPNAGWSDTIELHDPLELVEFTSIDVVWIGPTAWSLAQVSIDGKVRDWSPELLLGPSCRNLSVRVGGSELIGRTGLIERVELRPIAEGGRPLSLTRSPSDPRAFEGALPTLRPGESYALDARDRAGRAETLAELRVLPALELWVGGFYRQSGTVGRRFDEGSSGAQVLFAGTTPSLAVGIRRGGEVLELETQSFVDAELTWTLKTDAGEMLRQGEPQRVGTRQLSTVQIPLQTEGLRTGMAYELEVTVSDDRVVHSNLESGDSKVARFLWDADGERPKPRLDGRELVSGRVHYTNEPRSKLHLVGANTHPWRSTWSLDGAPDRNFEFDPVKPEASNQLALEPGRRHALTLEHRRTSENGIASDHTYSERYEIVVDTQAPRIVSLGIEAESIFEERTSTITVPVRFDDTTVGPGRIERRYSVQRTIPEGATELQQWTPWEPHTPAIPVRAPWQDPGTDGPYVLRVQARDEAGNVDETQVRVHAALEPPVITIDEPATPARVWEGAAEGSRLIAVRANDPNGVASVTARVRGALPDGQLTQEVELAHAAADRWTRTIRFGHEWSNAALELEVTATDAHGRARTQTFESELRLPPIDPPRAIAARRETSSTGPMQLVPGNRVGTYVFMGRDQRTEFAALEEALGALGQTRRAGRRDPYWRIEFEEGAIADFYLDEHEVSNEQFLRFVRATGGYGNPAHWPSGSGPDEGRRSEWIERASALSPVLPVTGVTWSEAEAFARWSGKRLPSLVEWEYAARGGQRYRAFAAQGVATFTSSAELAELLNIRWEGPSRAARAVMSGRDRTADTGLHDLTGNVREWTSSPCPDAGTRPRDHALELPELQLRPERRADWDGQADYWSVGSCFDSRRIEFNTLMRMPRDTRSESLGFRCALSVSAYRAARLSSDGPVAFEPESR